MHVFTELIGTRFASGCKLYSTSCKSSNAEKIVKVESCTAEFEKINN